MATTNGPSSTGASLIDTEIFTSLQAKIDEESEIRDQLKALVENLSKQGRLTQSILSRIHNVPSSAIAAEVLDPSKQAIQQQVQTVQTLATEASKYPFYKWNQLWQRDIQHLISSVQLHRWLETGQLMTVEEVGSFFNVPVNVKDQDTFHITIEDYLLALCSTIEELARLAPNAVTLGDYARPLQISKFIKDIHAGFQLLNLKNDALRRRSDGIKYSVKKVEDVVYDLSLRGLLPKEEQVSQ
ncbi:Translin-1 [Exophiala xenobiotica]|uniref:Translin-1 n=1 Tax=Lithohypha guttulata TaxID=1690604 RepID=A0ABR0KLB8_9EURO|nr:Translin-1 [Lithohypha guttulata]KAK5325965.1 Translin-1 [Exophiala xenobiotica]